MPERASGGGEPGAATGAATGQNLATCLGGHARAETVPALAFDIRRLKCLLHLRLKKSDQIRKGCRVNPGKTLFGATHSLLHAGKKGKKINSNLLAVKHCGS